MMYNMKPFSHWCRQAARTVIHDGVNELYDVKCGTSFTPAPSSRTRLCGNTSYPDFGLSVPSAQKRTSKLEMTSAEGEFLATISC